MALIINDTSYAGEFASYFWLPATFGMDSVDKGVVHVEDGIKSKYTIGRMDFKNPLQPRMATPVSGGTITVDGNVLAPKDMMVYTEFNPRNFESHWLAEELSPTLLARELPVTAENYMMQMALNRTFEQIENGIWMGSLAYMGVYPKSDPRYQYQYFDGFIRKFLNDPTVLAAASPATLTTTNITTAMDACITLLSQNAKAIIASGKRYERLKFLVSINTEQIYQTFQTTSLQFKGVNTTDKGINKYKGYEIVPLAGMPDDTIVLAEATPGIDSNLYVGMNSTEDNNLQLEKLQANSEIYFLKGLMKYDVQYGFGNQIALWTTLTQSSFL